MVISIKNLMKRYDGFLAIDHLSLEVEKGEIYGVLGPVGSGKTTLLQCLLSLISYDKGSIRLFGEQLAPNQNEIKEKIGVCFQEDSFFESLSVYDNLYYFANLYLRDKIRTEQAVQATLHFLEMDGRKNVVTAKLDEGYRKLLNLACGIVHNPELIMIDGGVGNVDPKIKIRIFEKLREIRDNGKSILYMTHSIEEAEEISDRIAIMDKGRILAHGTKEELKKSISLGEKSRIRVYHLTEEQIAQIRLIPGVFYVNYGQEILTVKSKKGKNNLIHILQYFQKNNIATGEITSELPTLNDVFWELTGKNFHG